MVIALPVMVTSTAIASRLNRSRNGGGSDPGAAPGADQEQVDLVAAANTGSSVASVISSAPRHRPRPDAVRQAQQRAAMRHAREAEAALAVGLDRHRARQMRRRGSGRTRQARVRARGELGSGAFSSAASRERADAEIDQHRRGDEHRRVGADQHHAEQHGGGEASGSPGRRRRTAPATPASP